jgi:ABC-2 type transport system ATP-binding protein
MIPHDYAIASHSPTPSAISGSGGEQTDEVVVQVEQLVKRYGKRTAVCGINFSVRRGEIFGLIGPDGAGKTSTFHMLGGVMEPSQGQVRVLGQMPRDARLNIGYLTQQFSLYPDLSIDENLRYSAGLRQVPDVVFAQRRTRYLRLMGLDAIPDRLAGQLSGGMKQKLFLCCCLIAKPQILLLDEPTTGVDPVSRRDFWDILAAIADDGVTIIVATPYLDEAERCHRIALMSDGVIYQVATLPEMRAKLGLQRLEVRTSNLTIAERMLHHASKQQPAKPSQTSTMVFSQPAPSQIADVQTFGDRLDVLVHDATKGIAEIQRLFQQHQLPAPTILPTDATLENVFVARLRQQAGDPPVLTFPGSRTPHPASCTLDSLSSTPPSTLLPPAIAAHNLQKTYDSFPAVRGIDLEIHYGEIYGLLGANGAGKTTTIKMLCGLIEPSAGNISLAGQTHRLRSAATRQRIGYMSQKFTLYNDLSIQENLEFYCGVYQVPRSLRPQRIRWVLETCGLLGKETMLTGKLPGGWKQRVAFGASVMHEPEILFLDEPTSGVDPLARRQFWRLINNFARNGTAILVTTHYLEETEQCNRVGFMVAGQIVTQGAPSEIKAAQPGQLLELVVANPQRAAAELRTTLLPWQVSVFGDRLHIVLPDPALDGATIVEQLAAVDIQVQSVRPIPFSMEDAFISIVQRSGST